MERRLKRGRETRLFIICKKDKEIEKVKKMGGGRTEIEVTEYKMTGMYYILSLI